LASNVCVEDLTRPHGDNEGHGRRKGGSPVGNGEQNNNPPRHDARDKEGVWDVEEEEC